MRTRPTWLMSIGFPTRGDRIPGIEDKGNGAVLTPNNDPASASRRKSQLPRRSMTRPREGHFVRIEPMPRLWVCERSDEYVLRELRDAFDRRGRASGSSPAGLPGRRADAA